MKIKDCILIEPKFCQTTDVAKKVAKDLCDIAFRHIFVVNDSNEPVGIISMIDINCRVVAQGKDPNVVSAEEIMTKDIKTFDIDVSVEDAFAYLNDNSFAMAPVTRNGAFVGIIFKQVLADAITIKT